MVSLVAICATASVIIAFCYFCYVRYYKLGRKKYLIKCFRYLSLVSWGIFMASILVAVLDQYGVQLPWDWFTVKGWMYAIPIAISWLIMVHESLVSREKSYIKHLDTKSYIQEHIRMLCNKRPEIMWRVATFSSQDSVLPIALPVIKAENKKVDTFILGFSKFLLLDWLIGLSYERPYLVLDLNSIMICMFFCLCVICWLTHVNQQFTV